jgi:hypothetical protein
MQRLADVTTTGSGAKKLGNNAGLQIDHGAVEVQDNGASRQAGRSINLSAGAR